MKALHPNITFTTWSNVFIYSNYNFWKCPSTPRCIIYWSVLLHAVETADYITHTINAGNLKLWLRSVVSHLQCHIRRLSLQLATPIVSVQFLSPLLPFVALLAEFPHTFLHNWQVPSSQLIQHPPEPHLVTLKMETLVPLKRHKKISITQSKNPLRSAIIWNCVNLGLSLQQDSSFYAIVYIRIKTYLDYFIMCTIQMSYTRANVLTDSESLTHACAHTHSSAAILKCLYIHYE